MLFFCKGNNLPYLEVPLEIKLDLCRGLEQKLHWAGTDPGSSLCAVYLLNPAVSLGLAAVECAFPSLLLVVKQ